MAGTGGSFPTSPWTFYSTADNDGRVISAAVTFSGVPDGNNTLTGAAFHRDAGCRYTKVIIGAINSDGSFPPGTRVIDVASVNGDRAFTAAQLHSVGLDTVADIVGAPQITVSP